MKNKMLYIVLIVFIVAGAVYSYRFLDFGGKTAIFFKIAFGDENTMMRMPSKKPPSGETGEFRPPERGHEGPGQSPAKRMRGKPGMGKIISLRNVIPYAFILAFFILVTRILDVTIRKILRPRS
jgi:hypothetical protein